MRDVPDETSHDERDAILAEMLAGESELSSAEQQAALEAAGMDPDQFALLSETWSRARDLAAWEESVRREALSGGEEVSAEDRLRLLRTVLLEAGKGLLEAGKGEASAAPSVEGPEASIQRMPQSQAGWYAGRQARWLAAAAALLLMALGARAVLSGPGDEPIDPGVTLGQDTALLKVPAPGSTVPSVDRLVWEVTKYEEDELRLFVEVQEAGGWRSVFADGRSYRSVQGTEWIPSEEERAALTGEVRVSLQIVPLGSDPLPKSTWTFHATL